MDPKNRIEVVQQAAKRGAKEASESFRSALSVETKTNKNDFVSDADRETQCAVVDHIRSVYPDEPIVAEENNRLDSIPDTGASWVIDPIDGTANYVSGIPLWTTTVAAVENGELRGAASILPGLDESYTADQECTYLNGRSVTVSDRIDTETFLVGVLGSGSVTDRTEYASLTSDVVTQFGDLRRFGCTTAALAFVASGHLDAAITPTPKHPWDLLAGVHLIKCAGGTVTDFDRQPWSVSDRRVAVSNGHAHEELVAVARAATEQ
jgi:myo-inositol-1(or 4)-monophosphatase